MLIDEILQIMPEGACSEIIKQDKNSIYEIRIKREGRLVLSTRGGNIPTAFVCTEKDFSSILDKLCQGSLHAYGETIKNGYIPYKEGIRVGVCGSFAENGIRDISSIVIRIPKNIRGIGLPLVRRLISGTGRGMLIYSPPGEGKTTLLRDIAITLSSPPHLYRVSVIDSRGELYIKDAFKSSVADIYKGYPKAFAIELATRTMAPQYIICDELGDDEARAILALQSCGVPLIASAHGDSLCGILKRRSIRELYDADAFGLYVGIKRTGSTFAFDITDKEKERGE